MGGIFKFGLLLILAMIFFAPPQKANALKCVECSVSATDPESVVMACQTGALFLSQECAEGNNICISMASVKDDGDDGTVTLRKCGKKDDKENVGIVIDTCKIVVGPNGKFKICICDTQDCNPSSNPDPDSATTTTKLIDPPPAAATAISTNSGSIYLNGWSIFQILIFSLIIIIDYGLTQ